MTHRRERKRITAKKHMEDFHGDGMLDDIISSGVTYLKSDQGKAMVGSVASTIYDKASQYLSSDKKVIMDTPTPKKKHSDDEKRAILKKLIDK